MPTFSVREARTHLSRLIARAEWSRPRERGSWKGRVSIDDSFFDPLPEDELAAWEQ